MNVLLNNEIATVLNTRRLPARLNTAQAGAVLGFSVHDIPILTARKMLQPLGKPVPNSTKYYAAREIELLAGDVAWLSRATKLLCDHWVVKNGRKAAPPVRQSPVCLSGENANLRT